MAFSGARAYRTSVQSVTGWQTISFSAARYDTGSYWSAGSPTRLTVPATGRYRVGHWLHDFLYSDDSTTLASSVMVNGSTVAAATSSKRYLSLEQQLSLTVVLSLAAGDHVEVQCYVDPATTAGRHAPRGYNTCLAEAWVAREG